MSTNLRGGEWQREVAFGLGAFVGMSSFALGIATLVLAMSIGFRRGQGFISPTMALVLTVVGVTLMVGGIVARLYRERISESSEDLIKTLSVVAVLVGAAMLLFRFSPDTTVSSPFLAGPEEKFILFGLAYGLIAVGLVILRGAARIVGW